MADHHVAVFSGPEDYADWPAVDRLVRQTIDALTLPADFIGPGDSVVLKPNWVKEHDERHPGPNHWEHIVTHPAVIESVGRWAAERLQGRGSVTICDAPQTDSSFARLSVYCGFDAMLARCRDAWPPR